MKSKQANKHVKQRLKNHENIKKSLDRSIHVKAEAKIKKLGFSGWVHAHA